MENYDLERANFLPPSAQPGGNTKPNARGQHTGHTFFHQHPEVYGYDKPDDLNIYRTDGAIQRPITSDIPYAARQNILLYPPRSVGAIERCQYEQPRPKINSQFYLSIFVVICCCWPLGLVALRQASRARTCNAQGRYDEAGEHARKAKIWSIVGILFGIVCYIIVGVGTYYRVKTKVR